jgi:phosphatidylglycerophosphatase A
MPIQYLAFAGTDWLYNGRSMKKAELLTTCFGLGKLPFCPGTWGSLPPVVMYQVLGYLYPAGIVSLMVFFIIAGSWVCVRYAPAVVAATGKKDPGLIVADEVAGQAITMLVIALLSPDNICNTTVLGFALFRLFDILKPWPCKRLEKLPSGVGILADDLMAGVYGGILAFFAIRHLAPQYCG